MYQVKPNAGKIIAEYRHALGMTQMHLGVKSGLTVGHISQIESGRIKLENASFRIAVAIANGLGKDVSIFIEDAPETATTPALSQTVSVAQPSNDIQAQPTNNSVATASTAATSNAASAATPKRKKRSK